MDNNYTTYWVSVHRKTNLLINEMLFSRGYNGVNKSRQRQFATQFQNVMYSKQIKL